jgi:hypothetical protein
LGTYSLSQLRGISLGAPRIGGTEARSAFEKKVALLRRLACLEAGYVSFPATRNKQHSAGISFL